MPAPSTRRKSLLTGILAALAITALWWNGNRLERPSSAEPPPGANLALPSGPGNQPVVTVSPLARELSTALLDENSSPESELEAVDQLLYFHRQAFGENPVGDNGDIVAALAGGNAKMAAWLAPDCAAVVNGRLVDRWGTPYWFHAISGREMEIRSAGPDRELFTGDDLFRSPVSR